MDLDEMLKQSVEPEAKEEVQQIETLQDGTTKETIENETGEIYYTKYEISSGVADKVVGLETKYEASLAEDLKLLAEVQARIDEKKEAIKKFIEENDLGSFKTNILNIKYTSATTTTSIDTTRLKKELPELAAKYSKVSSRASSISVGLVETPKLAKDLIQL